MSVTSVGMNNTAGANNALQQSSDQAGELGQDDFLFLLVAQLKAQDPLDPMDSAEFTSQLAQFNSIEQLGNINTQMTGLRAAQEVSNNVQAMGFIGKTVRATGGTVTLENSGSGELIFELASDSNAVFMNIYDAFGEYVRTLETAHLGAGEQSFTWDGTGNDGNRVPDGMYTFEVAATDVNNEMIPAMALTSGLVTGVTFRNGNPVLLAGQREIPIDSVIRVDNPVD